MAIPTFTGVHASIPTHFSMKETLVSVSHDDFTIVDVQTEEVAFNIRRQLTSVIRQKKTLTDNRGNILWICQHPLFKLFRRKYKFYSRDGHLLFAIRNHWTLPGQGKKLTIVSKNGQEIVFLGKLLDRIGNIRLIDRERQVILATVTKPVVSVRGIVTGLSRYTIDIQPNVDIAMCFAFVTILDEERERQHQSIVGKAWKAFSMGRLSNLSA